MTDPVPDPGKPTDLTPMAPAGLADLPFSAGPVRLLAAPWRPMTSIQPFAGHTRAVSDALQAALGIGLPQVGQTAQAGRMELRWMGQGVWFAIGEGEVPDLGGSAALTDQSDGWAVVDLTGTGARAVLARLCPLDLDPGVFEVGATARSDLAHMAGSVTATEAGFQLMVMRGFSATLVHDLQGAMQSVAAQAGLDRARAPQIL